MNNRRLGTAHQRSKSAIVVLILLLGIAWISCSKAPSHVAQKNIQTCDPFWYTTPEDNPRCYELQERLSEAAIAGDIPKIKRAIQDGANVNGGYYQSLPVLEQAAMSGQSEAVTYLIDAGANKNFERDFGQTALNSAVFYGHKETVKALLAEGADICSCMITDPPDPPALSYAIKSGDQEMVGLLVRAGALNCHKTLFH